MSIERITFEELKKRKLSCKDIKRLEKLKNMKDEDIDYSDIPEMTEEQLKQFRPAREVHPEWFAEEKKVIQLDTDVQEALKAQGKITDADVNAILRQAVLG